VQEIEQADLNKEGIYQAMVRIDQCCAAMARPKGLPAVKALAVATTTAVTSTPVTTSNHVKLPKLILHPLNGNITTWTTF
jgi:hypothetical protein